MAKYMVIQKTDGTSQRLPISEVRKIYFLKDEAHAIDLGLSVRWANCNLGATAPEEEGEIYAWGNTNENQYYDTSADTYTDISGTDRDAAHVKWGNKWRMPTMDELSELRENCLWEWTTRDGTNGYLVTGINGNSIFLPVLRYKEHGYYWSSTRCTTSKNAYGIDFRAEGHYASTYDCHKRFSIRPVAEN